LQERTQTKTTLFSTTFRLILNLFTGERSVYR